MNVLGTSAARARMPAIRSAVAASMFLWSSIAEALPLNREPRARTSVAREPISAAATDSLSAASVAEILARQELLSIRWSNLRDVSDALGQLYNPRDNAPLWFSHGVLTSSARAIITSLSRIDDRGLSPADYDVMRLMSLAKTDLKDADQRAEFDVTLSVATLRALRALYFGRVAPSEAHATLHILRDSVDLSAIVKRLVTSTEPESIFDAAEPQFPQYQWLKQSLVRYRDRAIGDPTLNARVAQIEVTLERWRWLPRTFAVAPVIVNIPAFGLEAWNADGDADASPLRMDVVAGSAAVHETPILADTIRFIEFAPYWIVPLSIATAELMPVAMRDPYVLTMNNYEIVNTRGKVLTPSVAALRLVTRGKAFIRQLPGGTNSLGRVKFMFPNSSDVYLHDSPVQSAFQRARRDQSHGCVRVADPVGLAKYLLRDQPEWTPERIDAAMNGGSPTRVSLTRGVPVFLFYATAVATVDGGMAFHDDIYGFDKSLAALLNRSSPYSLTVSETDMAPDSR